MPKGQFHQEKGATVLLLDNPLLKVSLVWGSLELYMKKMQVKGIIEVRIPMSKQSVEVWLQVSKSLRKEGD
jgi:hypothetical protein